TEPPAPQRAVPGTQPEMADGEPQPSAIPVRKTERMKILDEGKFDDEGQNLLVRVEDGSRRYTLAIAKEVLVKQFGAAPSGRFHEYWARVLENQALLETAAAFKLGESGGEDSDIIFITNADFPV
ncbi:MAG: hypothetical protein ACOC91_01895, partial [bacterium]